MRKSIKDMTELTDEELAFEMIEVTCDEMGSLTKVFQMLNDLCATLATEIVEESKQANSETQIH